MLGRTDRRLRLIVLLVVFAAMAVAAVARLSYWQLARGPQLRSEAMALIERTTEDLPLRGDIVDRNGAVLATTSFRYLLSASPETIRAVGTLGTTVERLGQILDLQPTEVQELTALLSSEDPYVVVRRRLTDDQSEAVRAAMVAAPADGGLVGLGLEPRPERIYPNPGGSPGTTLASHLLGFVTEQGEGQYGVEQFYDQLLAGQPTRVAALHDPSGQALSSSARILQEGRNGVDIALTIDAGLQLLLEKELHAAWVADRAKRVSAVILHPRTGEVLAWASVPGYDANDYARIAASSPELFIDPIATAVYEPGSVMKMLTAAAAFDAGVVTPDTEVLDSVSLSFGPYSIYNFDGLSRGKTPFRDAIAFSRNVATARVASRLDRTVPRSSARLYDMWTRLGIGQRSGVDVANESEGLVADPRETIWQPLDLANRAFGQGVAVTQLQLTVAYCAMANGGFRVTPHMVQAIDGEERAPPEAPSVLQPRRAQELQDLLHHVTHKVPWYREGTTIPGYRVGGKTATAQIWDPATNDWKRNTYNFTFVGFVGAEQPEAIIAVRIHDASPSVLGRGNLVLDIASYELFRRVAEISMTELEVAPLAPAAPPDTEDDLAPDRGQGDERRQPPRDRPAGDDAADG